MPFTPSHAAAALPLSRIFRRLPLPALVIGSMTPDFQYLLSLTPRGRFGHTAIGLLVFCLPVGLGAVLLFDRFVRSALVDLLPPGLAAAAGRQESRPATMASAIAVAGLAVLLGAASHIVWDGLTHGARWAVLLIPGLRDPVYFAPDSGVRWYRVLQHLSTVVGAAIIAIWCAGWARRHPPEARAYPRGAFAAALRVVAGLVVAAVLAGLANTLRAPSFDVRDVLGYGAVGTLSGLAVALVAYGVWSDSRRARPLRSIARH